MWCDCERLKGATDGCNELVNPIAISHAKAGQLDLHPLVGMTPS